MTRHHDHDEQRGRHRDGEPGGGARGRSRQRLHPRTLARQIANERLGIRGPHRSSTSFFNFRRSASIARCVATLSAPTLVPLAAAASLSDISRSFNSSIALRWPAGNSAIASVSASGSPYVVVMV